MFNLGHNKAGRVLARQNLLYLTMRQQRKKRAKRQHGKKGQGAGVLYVWGLSCVVLLICFVA